MVFRELHPELESLVWPTDESLKSASGSIIATLRRTLASILGMTPFTTPTLWNNVLRDHYVMGIKQYVKDRQVAITGLAAVRTKHTFPVIYAASSPMLKRNTGTMQGHQISCLSGKDRDGHCIYGPYFAVHQSRPMKVKFFISCSANASCTAVTLDIYDCKEDKVLAEQVVSSEKLNVSEYCELLFKPKVGQELEFRVYWHGLTDIVVDRLELHGDDL